VIAFAESLCVECGVAVEAEVAQAEFAQATPTVKRKPSKTGTHKRRGTSPGKRR
jgi:hypothetical protein